MFTEIAPSVFSVEHPHVEGKNGIVIGERAALAIDTGSYASEGQAMVDFIRERGMSAEYLVFTHGHNDHILGSAPFSGAEVVGHVLTPSVMQSTILEWAERRSVSSHQLGKQLAWPTVTFAGELNIDLGGKHLRLFPTPGHSGDSICVYIQEDRVLFAGDTVFSGIVPAIGAGDGRQLESTLRALIEMEIEVIVPGHGAILRGAESVREWLDWEVDYLTRIRGFIRDQLARGGDPEALAELVDYGEFIGDRIPVDRHGMLNRHRGTVSKIIHEESHTPWNPTPRPLHKWQIRDRVYLEPVKE